MCINLLGDNIGIEIYLDIEIDIDIFCKIYINESRSNAWLKIIDKNGHILPTGQWYAPSAVINDAWYWYCMVLHCIALYCIVLHGIAWYCMVLHDIAWYCMVLHGTAW